MLCERTLILWPHGGALSTHSNGTGPRRFLLGNRHSTRFRGFQCCFLSKACFVYWHRPSRIHYRMNFFEANRYEFKAYFTSTTYLMFLNFISNETTIFYLSLHIVTFRLWFVGSVILARNFISHVLYSEANDCWKHVKP